MTAAILRQAAEDAPRSLTTSTVWHAWGKMVGASFKLYPEPTFKAPVWRSEIPFVPEDAWSAPYWCAWFREETGDYSHRSTFVGCFHADCESEPPPKHLRTREAQRFFFPVQFSPLQSKEIGCLLVIPSIVTIMDDAQGRVRFVHQRQDGHTFRLFQQAHAEMRGGGAVLDPPTDPRGQS